VTDVQKFYRDQPNPSGYTWTDVVAWDDDDLEAIHDFIQWLFPTNQPSMFNPDAPLVSQQDIDAFRADAELQRRLLEAETRMRRFYHLGTPHPWWAEEGDHNLLRITRIITSLRLLAGRERAAAFLKDALASTSERPELARSIGYWKRAAE
jgi:hypothetical protein